MEFLALRFIWNSCSYVFVSACCTFFKCFFLVGSVLSSGCKHAFSRLSIWFLAIWCSLLTDDLLLSYFDKIDKLDAVAATHVATGGVRTGGVAGQGELIGTAADRQIQAHPLDARRGVIYDDLLGTTPLETVRNTHSVHHWSAAVAGRTVAVAAGLNHKTPQQRLTKSSRWGENPLPTPCIVLFSFSFSGKFCVGSLLNFLS